MFGRDTETSREDSSGLGFNGVFRRRAERELDWERHPGETSISQSVRLYLSNLDPDVIHKDNCEMVLRQVWWSVPKRRYDIRRSSLYSIVVYANMIYGIVVIYRPGLWGSCIYIGLDYFILWYMQTWSVVLLYT